MAEEAKRWSQLHRGHRQLLEQQAEAGVLGAAEGQPLTAAGNSSGFANNSSSGQYGRPVPRMLAASGTVPIRVWVEYQGIDSLSADGKQRLYDTVNIALGVLQKFYKVSLNAAAIVVACNLAADNEITIPEYNALRPHGLQQGLEGNSCGTTCICRLQGQHALVHCIVASAVPHPFHGR